MHVYIYLLKKMVLSQVPPFSSIILCKVVTIKSQERSLQYLTYDVVIDKFRQSHEFLRPFFISVARTKLYWYSTWPCYAL